MALLNVGGDLLALFRQHQAAVFLVIQVTQLAQLLHHAGDRRLFDLQGRCDVHDAGVPLLFDQLMDAFQVILSALTGR